MKYILYRSLGDLDKAVKKHELVAVETGKNIDDVTDALVKRQRMTLPVCRNMNAVRQRPMHRSRSKIFGRYGAISMR